MGAPWRLLSRCTATLKIMPVEFTSTFQEAWQVVMLSRLSVGESRTERSIGRLQTLGILTGERKGISASAVATTREALKTKPSGLRQMRNGVARVRKLSFFERFLDFSTLAQIWL